MTSILGANNMLNFIHLIREGDVDKHIFDLQSVHRGMHTSDNFTNLSNTCSISIVSADVLKLNAQWQW